MTEKELLLGMTLLIELIDIDDMDPASIRISRVTPPV